MAGKCKSVLAHEEQERYSETMYELICAQATQA